MSFIPSLKLFIADPKSPPIFFSFPAPKITKTINKIIINGNTKTSDHVIRRELRTLPGQKFSRTNIIRTQRELSQLGYFEAETMGINPIPHPQDGTVDIAYDLTEKANDQFTLSGGYGGFYGFVGTVGLVFNNFKFTLFLIL